MEQIKIKCYSNSYFQKEWINVVKYYGRKECGSVWFKSLLNQIEMKEDKGMYPDSIYFFIGDKVVMEQNEKREWLYVHYDRIWTFFQSEFGYNYEKTTRAAFINGMGVI